MTDIRSKRCVFVSHCMMAQCVRANGIVRDFPGPVRPVLQFCLDHDINIFQMPCPETLCSAGGLGRQPHGKKWYEERGLRDTARKIAHDQVEYIRKLLDSGYKILAIIGVEFSPACAVNFLNKGRMIVRDRGIFMEELQKRLNEHDLTIPFIGINPRWHRKLERQLNEMLDEDSERICSDRR